MTRSSHRSILLALVTVAALGSEVLPTPPQLRYQQGEIAALIHFNMATFVRDGDPGCAKGNWNTKAPYAAGLSRDPATFDPQQLDVDNWIESINAVGAKSAILTTKHGCGFLLWPTNTTFTKSDPYSYHAAVDVLQLYQDAMERAKIPHGFYYSLKDSFYMNVLGNKVQTQRPLLPGQVNVTQQEFESIAVAQLQEIWTRYGNLGEVWFDGGYEEDLKPRLAAMLAEHQPQAVAFNGYGIYANPVKWAGTTHGGPKAPIWSTGCSNGRGKHIGDPDSTQWCPAGVGRTLQQGDHWYYEPGMAVRSVAEMADLYHATVGQNCVMELDFAIDRTGRVHPTHAARYKEFGDWIRQCYGSPVASNFTVSKRNLEYMLHFDKPTSIDRVMIQEDQSKGQHIRNYTVEVTTMQTNEWLVLSTGQSVGNKRIDVAKMYINATAVKLTIQHAVGAVTLKAFSAYGECPVT